MWTKEIYYIGHDYQLHTGKAPDAEKAFPHMDAVLDYGPNDWRVAVSLDGTVVTANALLDGAPCPPGLGIVERRSYLREGRAVRLEMAEHILREAVIYAAVMARRAREDAPPSPTGGGMG